VEVCGALTDLAAWPTSSSTDTPPAVTQDAVLMRFMLHTWLSHVPEKEKRGLAKILSSIDPYKMKIMWQWQM
jgi:hypothetical protein